MSGIQVALDTNELKDGGSFRRTRILAEVRHQAGSAQLASWEYAYGNWVRKDSIHSERKILETVKQPHSIPGSSEKVRGDRNRAPVVFGTVVADSNK